MLNSVSICAAILFPRGAPLPAINSNYFGHKTAFCSLICSQAELCPAQYFVAAITISFMFVAFFANRCVYMKTWTSLLGHPPHSADDSVWLDFMHVCSDVCLQCFSQEVGSFYWQRERSYWLNLACDGLSRPPDVNLTVFNVVCVLFFYITYMVLCYVLVR